MQKTIIRTPTPLTPPPVSTETPSPIPLTPPGYFARVALAAALCTAAALGSLGTLLLRAGLPIHPLDMALIVLTLSALAGGLIGGYWTVRHIERPIRLEDQHIQAENEKMRVELAEMEARLAKPADFTGHQAHIAAYQLVAKYLTGQDTTKEHSGLDKKDHARAVVILRALGLIAGDRKGTHWTSDDPAEILARLLDIRTVEPDTKGVQRVWITKDNGQDSYVLEGGK